MFHFILTFALVISMETNIGNDFLTYFMYDLDDDSEKRYIEEFGANIQIELRDGR